MLAGLFNNTKDLVIKTKVSFIYNLLDWKATKQQRIQSLNNYNIWIVINHKKLPIRTKLLGEQVIY